MVALITIHAWTAVLSAPRVPTQTIHEPTIFQDDGSSEPPANGDRDLVREPAADRAGSDVQAAETTTAATDERYRTVVRDPGADDDLATQRQLDARHPGFATAIDLDREPGARFSDGLPEILGRSAGVTVRSIGGLGQFASVSLRGSTAHQVGVFLDGVPLTDAVGGLIDVGSLPLDALGRVEIHRGHVPVAFGGATIGGAINLVSRPGDARSHATVATGVGSFGARESRVTMVVPRGRTVWTSRAGYAGAEGNFRFFDNGGTPIERSDDQIRTRINNHYDRVLGQVRLDVNAGGWRFGITELGAWKRQGIPGPGSAQSRRTRLDTVESRTIATASRRFWRPGARLHWVAGITARRLAFTDPDNEVGIAVDDQHTVQVDGYVSPRLRLPLWRSAFLGTVADYRIEWAQVDERTTTPPAGDATRRRVSFGAGIELEQFLFNRRWLLVPVVRLDALESRFAAVAGGGEVGDLGRNDRFIGWSPRLGTRIRITSMVEMRATVGRYFRPPTLLELFGDRGYVVGNEGLRPETGTAVDGGFVLDVPLQRRFGLYAQATGFFIDGTDTIQWVTAGSVARPENFPGAHIAGSETALQVSLWRRIVTLHASYTFLHTANLDRDPSRRGAPLPGRPRHSFFGRLSTGYEWIARGVPLEPRAFYTTEVVSRTFLDPSARFELPTRVLHGLGAELHIARRAKLAAEVRNLTDIRTVDVVLPVAGGTTIQAPISDFIGYPLPGRSVWLTVSIDMDIPLHKART